MSEPYALRCRHCETTFRPATQRRLTPDVLCSTEYQYQDLLTGWCPTCHRAVYAWLGIDWLGEATAYRPIADKKQAYWDARAERDLVRRIRKAGAMTVQGSNPQFPWDFRTMVPVR